VACTWLTHAPLEQAQGRDPTLGAQVHLLAASVERQSDAYATAAAQIEEATALVQTHELWGMRPQIAFERDNLLANCGELPAALAAFAEAQQLAEESSNPVYAAMAQNNLAYHTLLTGDVTSAQAHIRAAEELTERYRLSFLWQFMHSIAGEIALAQGVLVIAQIVKRDRGNLRILGRFLLDLAFFIRCACALNEPVVNSFSLSLSCHWALPHARRLGYTFFHGL
jgi:hypothetical protein